MISNSPPKKRITFQESLVFILLKVLKHFQYPHNKKICKDRPERYATQEKITQKNKKIPPFSLK
jgi:hypothetical protein